MPAVRRRARRLRARPPTARPGSASGYLTKPFRTRELAMRVKAALRSVGH